MLCWFIFYHVNVLDLRHPGEWAVRGHVSQGEAALLVSADDGGLPGNPLRQLLHQLEGRQALQRRHPQALVSVEVVQRLMQTISKSADRRAECRSVHQHAGFSSILALTALHAFLVTSLIQYWAHWSKRTMECSPMSNYASWYQLKPAL